MGGARLHLGSPFTYSNAAAVRALPRELHGLMIAANNGHLLAFDNLSALPAWLSDALCRLARGDFRSRQLGPQLAGTTVP